jgi:glucose/arabinose dehydrogenase
MHRRGTTLLTTTVVTALVLVAACHPAKKKPPPPGIPTDPPALAIDRNFVTGLSNPWDVAFVPGDAGTMFFTERHGPIKVKRSGGTPVQLLPAPPDSQPGGEGGVMGIAVHPAFGSSSNRFLYVCYTTASDNRVVRFTVNASFTAPLINPVNLVTGMAKAGNHNGCRVRFGPDGKLWITMGDAGNASLARNPTSLNGKVLRVEPSTGAAASGNPIAGNRLWTLGHRNPQGLAFRANGEAYGVEHGPNTDDEVNLLVKGADYGWNGSTMTAPGATPAVWSSGSPTIAPSGATFVYGAQWKEWHGALAIAVLKAQRLQVFVERGGQLQWGSPTIVSTEVRLRSAVQGPDGNLYVATDVGSGGGAIWRIVPT